MVLTVAFVGRRAADGESLKSRAVSMSEPAATTGKTFTDDARCAMCDEQDGRLTRWWPKVLGCVLIAAMLLAPASKLHLPASLSGGAASVSAQEPAPQPVPQPTPAPTPDPISVPFVVKLDGPVKASGGFAVTVTKPAAAVVRWRNELPDGAFPLTLTDNDGRAVMVFLSPPAGIYKFYLSAQLPVAGLDPFAESSLTVEVGAPVVVPATPKPDEPTTPTVDPEAKVTAAVYVYLKDGSASVPSAVMGALNRLNREKKITATLFEQDTTDGTDDVPEQYKIPLAEAKKLGLPCLVVLAGSRVVRVVKNPTTEAAVMEAVP